MPPKKKKKQEEPVNKGDVKIIIGSDTPSVEAGVQVWNLKGEEVTAKGDRTSVAYLTTQDLFALGWVRRKH